MNPAVAEMLSVQNSQSLIHSDENHKIDAYWRACNYLCLGMLYLLENPLLREPIKLEHLKNRLIAHWGPDPGRSFVWVHLNRLIKKCDLNMIYISGPGGHDCNAVPGNPCSTPEDGRRRGRQKSTVEHRATG